MIPPTVRLEMVKHNTAPQYLTLNLNEHTYNLTGATVWFTVKRSFDDSDIAAVIQKKSPASAYVVDAESGLIKIPINPNDTKDLPDWYQDYLFDMQVLDANGAIVQVMQGTLSIYPTVTKSII